jgi:hypothetical protein
MRDDEIVQNIYLVNHSQADFLAEINGKASITPTEIKVKLLHSQIQNILRHWYSGCMDMAQGRGLSLALGKAPQYFSQKYMLLRPAHQRICENINIYILSNCT